MGLFTSVSAAIGMIYFRRTSQNPPSHELAACRQEKGAFGKPTIDCASVSDDPGTMTGSSQRQCELGRSRLVQSSRDKVKML